MAATRNQKGQGKTDNNKSDNNNNGLKNLVQEYGTQSNVLKGIGIAAGIGVLAYAAYKFIPFDKIFNNLEEAYDENFGEGQNANKQELANVEE
jgi:hypothetical protein